MPTRVLIALGSNLGDRRSMLDRAIADLASLPGLQHVATSSYHETAPVGGPGNQGPFLNAAATFDTTLAPHELHARLREIEATAGRVRAVRWGERTLDLDLILHGSATVDSPDLTVPHPRFAVRRFVLAPAAEIAPGLVDPLTGLTIAALLANVDRRPSRVVIATGFDEDGPIEPTDLFEGLVQSVADDLADRARPSGRKRWPAEPWHSWCVDMLAAPTDPAPRRYRRERVGLVGRWRPQVEPGRVELSPPTFIAVCGPGAELLSIDRPVLSTWSPTHDRNLAESRALDPPGASPSHFDARRDWFNVQFEQIWAACEATRTG